MALALEKTDKIPPRERILAAAGELFYRHGIRAVGVDSIAEAAGYLRQTAREADTQWDELAQDLPGDPLGQLRVWLKCMADHVANTKERGCALANAAVELPEKGHPARCVIEEFKTRLRSRLVWLCEAAGLSEPDMLADELHLLIEGARVTAQSVGADGLGARLIRMSEALIASHQR